MEGMSAIINYCQNDFSASASLWLGGCHIPKSLLKYPSGVHGYFNRLLTPVAALRSFFSARSRLRRHFLAFPEMGRFSTGCQTLPSRGNYRETVEHHGKLELSRLMGCRSGPIPCEGRRYPRTTNKRIRSREKSLSLIQSGKPQHRAFEDPR